MNKLGQSVGHTSFDVKSQFTEGLLDDDTFSNARKWCLFLLTASNASGASHQSLGSNQLIPEKVMAHACNVETWRSGICTRHACPQSYPMDFHISELSRPEPSPTAQEDRMNYIHFGEPKKAAETMVPISLQIRWLVVI